MTVDSCAKQYDGSDQLKVMVPGSNLCLDRPTEFHRDGENMQLWTCADPHTIIFSTVHDEQRMQIPTP